MDRIKSQTQSLLISFEKFLKSHNLKEKKILIAVSGGVDSLVLVDLFYRYKLNFSIAHCNFNLRGRDSEEDEVFVSELAKKYSATFFVKSFNISNRSQESIQMAARFQRYKWFFDLANFHKFDYIATAHHLDDAIETTVHNMCRGTGFRGLLNIYQKTNQLLIRPLISTSKKEIIDYAEANFFVWREDSSNQKNVYKRNFIRNEIVSRFKKINAGLHETFVRNFERWRGENSLLEMKLSELESLYVKNYENEVVIQTDIIQKEDFFSMFLHSVLRKYNFSYESIRKFVVSNPSVNAILRSKSHSLQIERGYWHVKTIDQQNSINNNPTNIILPQKIGGQVKIQLEFGISICLTLEKKSANVDFSKNSSIAYIDRSKLENYLTVRPWQPGDKFRPFGMKGTKKVSDYLNSLKLSQSARNRILLLLSNEKIVWVVGCRINDDFKVTDQTEAFYKFQLVTE